MLFLMLACASSNSVPSQIRRAPHSARAGSSLRYVTIGPSKALAPQCVGVLVTSLIVVCRGLGRSEQFIVVRPGIRRRPHPETSGGLIAFVVANRRWTLLSIAQSDHPNAIEA